MPKAGRHSLFLICLLLPSPALSETISPAELAQSVAEKRERVTEFRAIKALAEARGLRVFLFGGTASSFLHYAKWDELRSRGGGQFQRERFDYDYTSIYRGNQDLDIVITRADGTAESVEEIEAFQRALEKEFPYFRGERSEWEVRGLKTPRGPKEALLGNPDFLNQNTDSQSTSLVELTDSRAPVVRDLRDWTSTEPADLKDAAAGKIRFFRNRSLHFTTNRAKQGLNPEIIGAVRCLTKALQFGLEIDPESLAELKSVIDAFDPKVPLGDYASKWLERDGKKLVQNSIDAERTWNLLEDLGLRKKLIALKDNAATPYSLAWWLSKEPLRTKDHPGAHRFHNGNWTRARPGKTAGELGITVVAHETKDLQAYDAITRSPIGNPIVFISRDGASSEAAAYGDGFYTAKGEKGAAGTKFHIRFRVDPSAREGVDFVLEGNYVIWKSGAKLSVISESFEMPPAAALEWILDPTRADEWGLRERMRRRLSHLHPDEEAQRGLGDLLRRALTESKVDGLEGTAIVAEWLRLGIKVPSIVSLVTPKELLDFAVRSGTSRGADDILKQLVTVVRSAPSGYFEGKAKDELIPALRSALRVTEGTHGRDLIDKWLTLDMPAPHLEELGTPEEIMAFLLRHTKGSSSEKAPPWLKLLLKRIEGNPSYRPAVMTALSEIMKKGSRYHPLFQSWASNAPSPADLSAVAPYAEWLEFLGRFHAEKIFVRESYTYNGGYWDIDRHQLNEWRKRVGTMEISADERAQAAKLLKDYYTETLADATGDTVSPKRAEALHLFREWLSLPRPEPPIESVLSPLEAQELHALFSLQQNFNETAQVRKVLTTHLEKQALARVQTEQISVHVRGLMAVVDKPASQPTVRRLIPWLLTHPDHVESTEVGVIQWLHIAAGLNPSVEEEKSLKDRVLRRIATMPVSQAETTRLREIFHEAFAEPTPYASSPAVEQLRGVVNMWLSAPRDDIPLSSVTSPGEALNIMASLTRDSYYRDQQSPQRTELARRARQLIVPSADRPALAKLLREKWAACEGMRNDPDHYGENYAESFLANWLELGFDAPPLRVLMARDPSKVDLNSPTTADETAAFLLRSGPRLGKLALRRALPHVTSLQELRKLFHPPTDWGRDVFIAHLGEFFRHHPTLSDVKTWEISMGLTPSQSMALLERALPLLKSAGDFLRLTERPTLFPTQAWNDLMPGFIERHLKAFRALSPTAEEAKRLQARTGALVIPPRTAEGYLAAARASGHPKELVLDREQWRAFIALKPTVRQIKEAERISGSKTDEVVYHLWPEAMAVITTPAEFLALIERPRLSLEVLFQEPSLSMPGYFIEKHIDAFFALKPPPTAEEIKALQERYFLPERVHLEILKKAIPLMKTRSDFLLLVQGGPVRPTPQYLNERKDLILAHEARFPFDRRPANQRAELQALLADGPGSALEICTRYISRLLTRPRFAPPARRQQTN